MDIFIAAALVVFFGGLLSVAAPKHALAVAGEDGAAGKFSFVARENFDGKLRLNWQPIRHDPTHISLKKNKGKLTITTQRGTIHADEKARGEPSAKNIFVFQNPLANDVDFVMTTCISEFKPTEKYQQAGLICYDDDDNYVKWGYEYSYVNGGGPAFGLILETNAKPEHNIIAAEANLKRIWLRLTRSGTKYEYASSTDGDLFTVHGQRDWEGKPRMLGVLAKNGGLEGVTEIDACFDFFELKAPPPPKESK
jgi:regulation of enolase protein 1 (concanavalin A-like superfamily)